MTNCARELSEPSTITDIDGKYGRKRAARAFDQIARLNQEAARMTKNILPYEIAKKAKQLRKALQRNQISESIDLAAEIETLANEMVEEGKE